MSNSAVRQFTVIEIIGAVIVVLVFGLLLLSAISHGHGGDSRPLRDLVNVKQINIGIFAYATDNNGYRPGIDSDGNLIDPDVENRYSLIVDYIGSDYLISPYESKKKNLWTSGPVTRDHYSYAMLQLPESGGRLSQWNDQADAIAAWVSGRNTGTDADTQINSLQTNKPGEWHGPVGWADGHVTQEEDQYVDTRYTVGSNTPLNKDDNLFEAVSEDDAYMIYTGN